MSFRGTRTGRIGAIRELKVAVDLTSKGWEVYRAMSPDSPCDLLIMRGATLLRVEVTGGRITTKGDLSHPHQKQADRYDVLACFLPGEVLIYRGLPE
jgi:hypothetical protein